MDEPESLNPLTCLDHVGPWRNLEALRCLVLSGPLNFVGDPSAHEALGPLGSRDYLGHGGHHEALWNLDIFVQVLKFLES